MAARDTYLRDALIASINSEGPLRIDEFMRQALWHPQYGYYSKSPVFGAHGDFITAPEITQIFGELVGLWCVDMFQRMPQQPHQLIELGPGRGVLMADILRVMSKAIPHVAKPDIHLVEMSSRLVEEQKSRLGGAVQWHAQLQDIPPAPCLILANEFFDALPIRQFVRTKAGWRERLVGINSAADSLQFVLSAEEASLPHLPSPAPEGAIMEISQDSDDLIATIAARISEHQGAALIIDYGSFESGLGDSLQAMRRHQYADVLDMPGSADLTTHVDFARLSHIAREKGLMVDGPVTQSAFLTSLGIHMRAEQLLLKADSTQAELIHTAVKRLLDAKEMGTLFKVMCIRHAQTPVPCGFESLISNRDAKNRNNV